MADKPANQMCEGKQYAEVVYGQDNYVTTTRNEQNDEMPASTEMWHAEATPGHSNSAYVGRQYNTDVKSGTSVADKGQSPSKESVGITGDDNSRGKES